MAASQPLQIEFFGKTAHATLPHTGTYTEGFDGDCVLYFTLGDTKLALIACTFSTNYGVNHQDLEGNRSNCINMIHPPYISGHSALCGESYGADRDQLAADVAVVRARVTGRPTKSAAPKKEYAL